MDAHKEKHGKRHTQKVIAMCMLGLVPSGGFCDFVFCRLCTL